MIDSNPSNAGSSDAGRAVRPFVLMLICSAVIVIGLLVIKITTSFPGIQYTHLLVNYDFGVIKRALVGAVVSLFRPKVGLVDVYVVGLTAWLAALIAYLAVFRRTFGFSERTFPLLAIILSSPVFFKNFMFSIGYFDVLGCLAALIALLLPVNLALPLIMGVISCVLLFVHHLHLLLYVPTIGLIVLLRIWPIAASICALLCWPGWLLQLRSAVVSTFSPSMAACRFRWMNSPPRCGRAPSIHRRRSAGISSRFSIPILRMRSRRR